MFFLTTLLHDLGLDPVHVDKWLEAYYLLAIAIVSFIVYMLTKKIVLRYLEHYILNNKYTFDNVMLEKKVFSRCAQIVPAVVIYLMAESLPTLSNLVQRLSILYMVVIGLAIVDALLRAVETIYKSYEVSKTRPIKSYLQVIKILAFIFGAITFIANIMGKSPVYLLSGIGAMTAILMLIFKDSILGLVAGIQLTTNDMVRIGDWIEMPKYSADGDVVDISLNTVKVENFDRTITTIPTYALISDAFKNWRGMSQSGGRRIKRSIFIDQTSIQFCSDEMIEHFSKIACISEYIQMKNDEIKIHNAELTGDSSLKINGRHLTNIGVFRAYIQHYLEQHPRIHSDMIIMARQLAPCENGLPIEVYCFTSTTVWSHYESIQADIFDHLFAVISLFELRIHQQPSGFDFHGYVQSGNKTTL